MRRIATAPRADWQKKVEEAGLTWHSGERIYWNESAFYEFTAKEVDALEAATNELEAMTLAAAQHIIDNKLYSQLSIPEEAVPLIEASWEAEPPSLYGRFDLAYDGANPPKLLEYNADTPTSLVEAAVAQWYWLQDTFPRRDQFNSIHERLVASTTDRKSTRLNSSHLVTSYAVLCLKNKADLLVYRQRKTYNCTAPRRCLVLIM